jgi:Flp pilus assembly protein TadG
MKKLMPKFKDQRGAVIIVVAIAMLFFMIGFAALAVDVGYLYATKNELQNIADAGALAGAGKLGQIYTTLTPEQQDTYDFANVGRPLIQTAAQEVVTGDQRNIAGGKDIIIDNENDVFINNINGAGTQFNTNNFTLPDAVRVYAHSNGPVSTFFGKIFGITGWAVSADATAALTTLDEIGPGKMNMPIGISENWFEPPTCEDTIKFSPTTSSCAGWHNFFDAINANAMSDKLLGFILDDPTIHDTDVTNDQDPEGTCSVPPCGRSDPSWLDVYFDMNPGQVPPPMYTMGVESEASFFEFQGGTISALFNGGKLDWETDDHVTPVWDGGDPPQQVVIDDPIHPAPFFAIFDYFRFRDGIEIPTGGISVDTDGDGIDDHTAYHADEVWSALVPVYKDEDECINPNTSLEIVGFAIIHVIMPNPPPDSTVTAKIDCNLTFIGGQGSGGTKGNVRGTIPNLVE